MAGFEHCLNFKYHEIDLIEHATWILRVAWKLEKVPVVLDRFVLARNIEFFLAKRRKFHVGAWQHFRLSHFFPPLSHSYGKPIFSAVLSLLTFKSNRLSKTKKKSNKNKKKKMKKVSKASHRLAVQRNCIVNMLRISRTKKKARHSLIFSPFLLPQKNQRFRARRQRSGTAKQVDG